MKVMHTKKKEKKKKWKTGCSLFIQCDAYLCSIQVFLDAMPFYAIMLMLYQGRILPTGTRDSTLEILLGENGWVTHHENGIIYSFDATKCMFSSGNLSEKCRIAQLDCADEIIVDLFAGIGYFVLPFLVKYGQFLWLDYIHLLESLKSFILL